MAKKTKLSSDYILTEYSNYVVTEGKKPNSIFHFCQHLKIEEKDFYSFFTNFEQIEAHIFTSLFGNTLRLLENNEDYQHYDAKTKLLSFYYTFFEHLTANRSCIVYLLQEEKNHLKSLKKLSLLRSDFKNFIATLGIEPIKIPQETIEKIQHKSIAEFAWVQFLMTLKFWLDDSSPTFEKTDIFIEKSVHASFDLIDLTPVKNIIDFGKFLWKEKIQL
ncbi:TetR family transcriptional regulator C-terminal domain-containing protein [Flavobacterium sp. J27]|uniref:TetR family transcriptional regulator C-terminal domain-containing protein n=1 Tax=Flavobacterium sp. J27 TaxID=2060419 RepID=UPI001030D226|nr:TetR family transcriptional regulator C-terminal domain-containing protein [Flavobacterium sp. J27]